MYGWLHSCTEDLVINQFGAKSWLLILDDAGYGEVGLGGWYNETYYDDKVIYNLVAAASRVLMLDANTVLDAFGAHFVEFAVKAGYDRFMRCLGSTFEDFVKGLDRMHRHLQINLPEIVPPAFWTHRRLTEPGVLYLHYSSTREGLWPMVPSLCKEVARRYYAFELDVQIEKPARVDKRGSHTTVFRLTVVGGEAAENFLSESDYRAKMGATTTANRTTAATTTATAPSSSTTSTIRCPFSGMKVDFPTTSSSPPPTTTSEDAVIRRRTPSSTKNNKSVPLRGIPHKAPSSSSSRMDDRSYATAVEDAARSFGEVSMASRYAHKERKEYYLDAAAALPAAALMETTTNPRQSFTTIDGSEPPRHIATLCEEALLDEDEDNTDRSGGMSSSVSSSRKDSRGSSASSDESLRRKDSPLIHNACMYATVEGMDLQHLRTSLEGERGTMQHLSPIHSGRDDDNNYSASSSSRSTWASSSLYSRSTDSTPRDLGGGGGGGGGGTTLRVVEEELGGGGDVSTTPRDMSASRHRHTSAGNLITRDEGGGQQLVEEQGGGRAARAENNNNKNNNDPRKVFERSISEPLSSPRLPHLQNQLHHLLSAYDVLETLPYHIVFHYDLRVISVGKLLSRIMPQLLEEGALVSESFNIGAIGHISRPNAPVSTSSLVDACARSDDGTASLELVAQECLPNAKHRITMLGVVKFKKSKDRDPVFLFHGCPNALTLAEITEQGLYLDDCPLYASNIDLLMEGERLLRQNNEASAMQLRRDAETSRRLNVRLAAALQFVSHEVRNQLAPVHAIVRDSGVPKKKRSYRKSKFASAVSSPPPSSAVPAEAAAAGVDDEKAVLSAPTVGATGVVTYTSQSEDTQDMSDSSDPASDVDDEGGDRGTVLTALSTTSEILNNVLTIARLKSGKADVPTGVFKLGSWIDVVDQYGQKLVKRRKDKKYDLRFKEMVLDKRLSKQGRQEEPQNDGAESSKVFQHQKSFDRLRDISVEGSRTWLIQVVTNLLSNAYKFTERGTICVTWTISDPPIAAAAEEEEEEEEGARKEKDGEHGQKSSARSTASSSSLLLEDPANLIHVKVQVSDTGMGIAKEQIPSVLEEFGQIRTGNDTNSGTGLGLPLSKRMTEAMGGTFVFESELGVGTTVTVELNMKMSDAPTMGTIAERTENPFAKLPLPLPHEASSMRPGLDLYCDVLAVEDNALLSRMYRRKCERIGLSVKCVEDGADAVELIESGWKFGVILMDMTMPVMNGDVACQLIRKPAYLQGPDYKGCICLVTGNAYSKKQLDELQTNVGFDYVFQKGETPSWMDLIEYLAEHISGKNKGKA